MNWRVCVRVTLRLAIYRQSVHLADKPLETHDHYLFPAEHLRLKSLCSIVSDDRMCLSFTIAPGPHHRSHSRVRARWDSWPYFTVSDSTLPKLEGKVSYSYPPGRWWPGYIPGTGIPFCGLLRLAGLRWRYSTAHPQGIELSIVIEYNLSISAYLTGNTLRLHIKAQPVNVI
jgi:hypothetical protein